jgi:hypothetical protein
VELVGDPADIAYARHALDPRFDPHVENIDERPALISKVFDRLTVASDVRDAAQTIVAVVNGSVRLTMGGEPLRCGTVYRVWEDGRRSVTTFPSTGTIRLSGFPPTVTVHDKDGNLVSPPPAPTSAQQWIAAALDDDDIADLLTFFGRADNWFDLYKTIEMVQKIEGGEHALMATFPGLKPIKTTANSFRHARAHAPESPVSFKDAYEVVGGVVRAVLGKRSPPTA